MDPAICPFSICMSADRVWFSLCIAWDASIIPDSSWEMFSPPRSLGNQSPTFSKSQSSSSCGVTWLGEGTIRIEDCSSDFAEV